MGTSPYTFGLPSLDTSGLYSNLWQFGQTPDLSGLSTSSTASGASGAAYPTGTTSGQTGQSVAPTSKLGNGLEMFSNFAEGLGSLAQIYMGMKALGLAQDQFKFSKEAFQTNLANQRKSYNTSLEDRIRSRYVAEGKTSAEADAYLANNSL